MKVTLTNGGEKMGPKQEISKTEACCYTEPFATGRFHWHEKYELCRVLKRSCTFRVDGHIHEAQDTTVKIQEQPHPAQRPFDILR